MGYDRSVIALKKKGTFVIADLLLYDCKICLMQNCTRSCPPSSDMAKREPKPAASQLLDSYSLGEGPDLQGYGRI